MRGFVASCVLLLIPAMAPALPWGGLPPEIQQEERSAEAAASSKPLFYSLGTAPSLAQTRQVAFLVKLEDRLLVQEVIDLPSGSASGVTLELLATDPDTLDRLYQLADEGTGYLSVTVLADGREVRSLSFQELVAYNREIKTTTKLNLVPRKSKVVSSLSRQAAADPGRLASATAKGYTWQLNQTCANQCQDQYYTCQEIGCGFQDDCDSCHQEYESCVSGCWVRVCTDPKSVNEYDDYELISAYYLGQQCLQDPFQRSCWMDQYQYYYKVSRIRVTEYCNGTTSTQVLYYNYGSTFSEEPTLFSCSFATGYTNSVCW